MSTSSIHRTPPITAAAWCLAASRLAAASMVLGGCAGDSIVSPNVGPGGAAVAPQERACTPDPALVRTRRACTVDSQCPCGAHCDLGVCVAECGAGVFACYRGEYCDTFGRCRAEAERGIAVMRVPAAEGELTLGVSSLSFGAATDARALEYVLSGVSRAAVRFDVGAPYQVRCDQAAAWGSECTVPAVPGETVKRVEVRVAPGTSPMPTAIQNLRAWWGHNSRVVTIVPQAAAMDAAGLKGLYEGTATLSGNFLGANVSLPITAKVYATAAGTTGTIVFTDESTLFAGKGNWVGSMAVDASNGNGTLTLPARAPLTDRMAQDLPVGVLATPTAATPYTFARSATSGNTINLTLPITLSNQSTSMLTSWVITLRRTGDLTGAAPEVPAAATLEAQPMGGLSRWEASLAGSYRSLPSIPLAQGDDMLRTLANAPSSPRRRLETCKPSLFAVPSERVAYLTQLLYGAPAYVAEPGEVTDLGRFSGGSDLSGPLLTRDAVTAALLSPFYTAITSQWGGNTRANLVDWNFVAAQTNTSATTLPCDLEIAGPTYVSAFCNQNISNASVGISRCSYFSDLGWDRFLSNRAAGSASGTAGAISTSTLRYEVDYGIPLVPEPTDPTLPRRRACIRSSSAAVAFEGRRFFAFNDAPFERPTSCAALTACALGANSSAGSALDSSTFDATARGRITGTGDLRCEGGRGLAFELDLRRDAGVNVSSDELLTTCFLDLDRLLRVAPTVAGSTSDTGAAALFGTQGCIDGGRFLLSLTTAMEDYKAGALTTAPAALASAKGPNARIAHRLLQQWIGLHAAIAVQATQYAIVPDSIRGVRPAFTVPRGTDSVDRVARGLALLLHPRVSSFLTSASGSLVAPDYRPATAGVATSASDPQQQHLVVQREQLVGALLGLVDPLLDTALRNRDQASIEKLVRALRVVTFTRLDDDRLHASLVPAGTTPLPAWESAYQAAWTAVSGKLATLLSRLTAAQALANPLGIDPGEVPLYFSGDPAGPAARFTPVSDYLLGVGASTGAWAPAAVAQAQASADAVTRSFRTLATRTYQSVQTANDVNEHLEAVRNDFGGQVSSYCGGVGDLRDGELLEGWQAAAGAPFDAGSCYLRTDDAACRVRFAAQAAAAQREALMPQIVIARADVLNQACIASRGYFTETTTVGPVTPLSHDITRIDPDITHSVTIATRPVVFGDPRIDAIGRMQDGAFSATVLADPAAATGTTVGCSDVRPCSFDTSSLCITCRGLVYGSHDPVVYSYVERGRVEHSNGRVNPAFLNGASGVTNEVAQNMIGRYMVVEAAVTFASVFNQVTRPSGSEAALAANTTACLTRFAGARTVAPPSLPPPAEVDDGSCFRGSLGQSVLNVRSLTIAVQTANEQFDSLFNQYDIAMQTCNIQHAAADDLATAQGHHNRTMTGLRSAKFALDTVALAANTVRDCLNTSTIAAGGALLSAGGSVTVAVGSCVSGAIGAVATGLSNGLQLGMTETEQSHAVFSQDISDRAAYRACVNDAGQFLTGARAATLAVAQARQDMLAAMYSFNQDVGAAQAAFDEGNMRLATVRDRQNTPPEFDDPLDLNVQTYRRQMRVARRVTFLAVRAVEYELQASLEAENGAIVAESPADLQVVLEQLRLTAATRRVQGSAPAETLTILSLRDHLLQLQDTSAASASEQTLTPTQRFRNVLQSEQYAVRNAAGVYLGQGIPFAIGPVGRQGTGAAQGISLLAGSDCAERVWSVNFSVLGVDTGAQPLVVGNDERTFIRLEVHKSNSFYSQWCDAARTDYQTASFRPAVNLFQEPGVSGNITAGGTVSSSSDNSLTRARVRAHINVSREDFETSAYVEGSSAELAGRGLYGSYVLFIPAGSISTTGTTGATVADAGTTLRTDAGTTAATAGDAGTAATRSTPGLNLGLVNDILLRLDYVSVARPVR